jgi:Baseplate J-like protein
MPLPVPNLDDRGFDQLAAEARALIPRNLPTWTDHNESDPGITLLELFAFLVESAIYQANRVPERSLRRFADLVDAASGPSAPIATRLREARAALERRDRAVTASEFEALARAASSIIARSKALVDVIDPLTVFSTEQFIRVAIVPNEPTDPGPRPTDALRETVFNFLRARRLITARLQVVSPVYTEVRIEVTVVRDSGKLLSQEAVRQNVAQAILRYLSPLAGGVDGAGWEFGRSVFRSELYQQLEGLPGVDHVARLVLNGDEKVGEVALSPLDPASRPVSLVRLADLDVTVVDG